MRRREPLHQQRRIEGNAAELAQAADQPDEMRRRQLALQAGFPPVEIVAEARRKGLSTGPDHALRV
jgi:hypothetical protein